MSQTVPVWPWQSAFVMHFPHWPAIEPARKQKGCVVVPHGSVAVLPLSPLQGTQVSDAVSQSGVEPEHCDESVHWKQVLVVALQCGAVPGHCESITQATQLPELVPVVAQIVERHTVSPLLPVQGPSPLA